MMKNPCAKLFIWLLFSLLCIPSGLLGQGGTFTVSMYESELKGNDDLDLYSTTSPICLVEQGGSVTVDFNAQFHLFDSKPPNSTIFQIKYSIYGVSVDDYSIADPNDAGTYDLIPVPLIYSTWTPSQPGALTNSTYAAVSGLQSPQNHYLNFNASLNFNFLIQSEPIICEYIIKVELYYKTSDGLTLPEIYNPTGVDGQGLTVWYGNLIKCGFFEDNCETIFDGGINDGSSSDDRLSFNSSTNSQLELGSIHPNPASTSAIVNFTSSNETEVSILDLQGRRMDIPQLSESFIAGEHAVKISLEDFGSGIYFVQLRSGSTVKTKKLVIVD